MKIAFAILVGLAIAVAIAFLQIRGRGFPVIGRIMPVFQPRVFLCRLLLAAGTALPAVAAAADLPPEIVEDTDRALVFCQDLGGKPSILPGYERRLDLNGDGREDVVTDQAGLACEGSQRLLRVGGLPGVGLAQPPGAGAGAVRFRLPAGI